MVELSEERRSIFGCIYIGQEWNGTSSPEHQDCVVHTLATEFAGCPKRQEFQYLLMKRTVVLLTHTLVPLIVLQVALRTAAPVSTYQVLTAMLTPVVTITLIHICQGQKLQ